jgi:hypothetical protein
MKDEGKIFEARRKRSGVIGYWLLIIREEGKD